MGRVLWYTETSGEGAGGSGDSALHRRGLGTPGCGCGHGEHDLVRGCPGVRSACRSFMDVPGHSPPPTTNIDARLLCAESDDPWTPTWLPYHPWRRVARCWFEPMGDASRPGVSHVFHTCDTAPGHDTHILNSLGPVAGPGPTPGRAVSHCTTNLLPPTSSQYGDSPLLNHYVAPTPPHDALVAPPATRMYLI